jgi:hypothetical protein
VSRFRWPGDGPAGCGAGLLDAMAGLARCPVALRWRRAVAPSCGLAAGAMVMRSTLALSFALERRTLHGARDVVMTR